GNIQPTKPRLAPGPSGGVADRMSAKSLHGRIHGVPPKAPARAAACPGWEAQEASPRTATPKMGCTKGPGARRAAPWARLGRRWLREGAMQIRWKMVLVALPMLALVLPAAVDAQAPAVSPEPLAAAVDAKVQAWRRDFHQHPELSNREFRTAEKVASHLAALGLTPETGVAHTGVVALLEGGLPGPRIMLRADMDALPVTERSGLPFASTATGEYRGETVGVMHA